DVELTHLPPRRIESALSRAIAVLRPESNSAEPRTECPGSGTDVNGCAWRDTDEPQEAEGEGPAPRAQAGGAGVGGRRRGQSRPGREDHSPGRRGPAGQSRALGRSGLDPLAA